MSYYHRRESSKRQERRNVYKGDHQICSSRRSLDLQDKQRKRHSSSLDHYEKSYSESHRHKQKYECRSRSRSQSRSKDIRFSSSRRRLSSSPDSRSDSQTSQYEAKSFSKTACEHLKRKDSKKPSCNISEKRIVDASEGASIVEAVKSVPLPPKCPKPGAYHDLDTEEPIDKEKIHREIEEKLRQTLAKEGKVYPPPKPEPSHPVFANDGSFIEIFKKMQQSQLVCAPKEVSASNELEKPAPSASSHKIEVPKSKLSSFVGRRRGGKILKTGLVSKPKTQSDDSSDPKDFWSIYLREVNKYKSNACESDNGTRPLVK